jgi:hypothetical protein
VASWSEIERIRRDADGARAIAKGLLSIHRESLTEWEREFLENLQRSTFDELSPRQSEKLLEIRDDYQVVSNIRGISVGKLLHGCYECRLDLNEADSIWIEERCKYSRHEIQMRHARRLTNCAVQLQLIESYLAA